MRIDGDNWSQQDISGRPRSDPERNMPSACRLKPTDSPLDLSRPPVDFHKINMVERNHWSTDFLPTDFTSTTRHLGVGFPRLCQHIVGHSGFGPRFRDRIQLRIVSYVCWLWRGLLPLRRLGMNHKTPAPCPFVRDRRRGIDAAWNETKERKFL